MIYALLALAVLLQLVDLFSTDKALRLGLREGNPIVRAAQERLGRFGGTLLFKAVGVAVAVYIAFWLPPRTAVAGLLIFNAIYLLVACNNLRNIKRAKKGR